MKNIKHLIGSFIITFFATTAYAVFDNFSDNLGSRQYSLTSETKPIGKTINGTTPPPKKMTRKALKVLSYSLEEGKSMSDGKFNASYE